MSTKATVTVTKAVGGFLAGSIVLMTGTLLILAYGPEDMGKGFALGGAISLSVFAFAVWRVTRRPTDASSFERAFTGAGDERDRMVAEKASAVVGLVSIPATGIAAVAVAMGASADVVLAVLLFGLLAVAVVSEVVAARRT
jgi:hypothetical protein